MKITRRNRYQIGVMRLGRIYNFLALLIYMNTSNKDLIKIIFQQNTRDIPIHVRIQEISLSIDFRIHVFIS